VDSGVILVILVASLVEFTDPCVVNTTTVIVTCVNGTVVAIVTVKGSERAGSVDAGVVCASVIVVTNNCIGIASEVSISTIANRWETKVCGGALLV